MAYGTRVMWDAVRELAFGGISGSYAALGTPLGDHIRILTISNSTDQEVYISFDGSTDHLRMPKNSFKLYDIASNKIRDDGMFLASGVQMYVKEVLAAVTEGAVWIEVAFGEGGK